MVSYIINLREYRKGNQKWIDPEKKLTSYGTQHDKNQKKTQKKQEHNTKTPLCENKHK